MEGCADDHAPSTNLRHPVAADGQKALVFAALATFATLEVKFPPIRHSIKSMK
jgi:hypothetical protein